MPTISIDTFFACSLMVSVVIITIALSANALDAHLSAFQNLSEEEYLRVFSEFLVSNCGSPTSVPGTLGLAKTDSQYPWEVDADKVCRLNSQNAFALKYSELLKSSGLNNIALGISISQMIDISTSLSSNVTSENSTIYVFNVHASQQGTPVVASLHCYIFAEYFETEVFNNTSTDGNCCVEFNMPNSVEGPSLLVTFARASYDPRITAYEVHPFAHLSQETFPNDIFLHLSPLNNTLYVNSNSSDLTIFHSYVCSYSYQTNMSIISDSAYAIPRMLESPLVLVMTGSNSSTSFVEWTAYPQLPLEIGSDFADSESHSFNYIVATNGNLYRLVVRLGGLSP
jgi:hypothetical protein